MQTDQITDPHALLNGTECRTPPTPEPASTALAEVRSLFSRRAGLRERLERQLASLDAEREEIVAALAELGGGLAGSGRAPGRASAAEAGEAGNEGRPVAHVDPPAPGLVVRRDPRRVRCLWKSAAIPGPARSRAEDRESEVVPLLRGGALR